MIYLKWLLSKLGLYKFPLFSSTYRVPGCGTYTFTVPAGATALRINAVGGAVGGAGGGTNEDEAQVWLSPLGHLLVTTPTGAHWKKIGNGHMHFMSYDHHYYPVYRTFLRSKNYELLGLL